MLCFSLSTFPRWIKLHLRTYHTTMLLYESIPPHLRLHGAPYPPHLSSCGAPIIFESCRTGTTQATAELVWPTPGAPWPRVRPPPPPITLLLGTLNACLDVSRQNDKRQPAFARCHRRGPFTVFQTSSNTSSRIAGSSSSGSSDQRGDRATPGSTKRSTFASPSHVRPSGWLKSGRGGTGGSRSSRSSGGSLFQKSACHAECPAGGNHPQRGC